MLQHAVSLVKHAVKQFAVTPPSAYIQRMETVTLVGVRFRLAALLEEAGVSQRELASRSGVSPTTINRMANNLTAQVSLGTLDSLSATLSEVLKREVEPGELIERESSAKRRKHA